MTALQKRLGSGVRHNYYSILIPDDIPVKEALDLAIYEARDRARIYAMPATWRAHLIATSGGFHAIKVRRTRRAT